jgi:hypothetical protein
MKNRHLPKVIIYDVNPSFDLLVGENNSKYLGWLRSEYDNDDVKQIFEDIDLTEKYKMQSMMYRYNSKFLQNMIDYVHPIFQISPNGYLPLKGDLDRMKINDKKGIKKKFSFDTIKLAQLKAFVHDVKELGVQLVFVASPIWYGKDDDEFAPIKDLCNKEGVTFYNYSNDADFVRNDEMFKDGLHLNSYGADVFTKEFCNNIRKNW